MNTPPTTLDASDYKYIEVYGTDFRSCVKDMCDTTTRLGLWDWFRTESPPENSGYMYWGHPNVNKISNGLQNNEHSGATFGYCMRLMQAIAKQGFAEWNGAQQVPG